MTTTFTASTVRARELATALDNATDALSLAVMVMDADSRKFYSEGYADWLIHADLADFARQVDYLVKRSRELAQRYSNQAEWQEALEMEG